MWMDLRFFRLADNVQKCGWQVCAAQGFLSITFILVIK